LFWFLPLHCAAEQKRAVLIAGHWLDPRWELGAPLMIAGGILASAALWGSRHRRSPQQTRPE